MNIEELWRDSDRSELKETETTVSLHEPLDEKIYERNIDISTIAGMAIEEQKVFFEYIFQKIIAQHDMGRKTKTNGVLSAFFASELRSEKAYYQCFFHLFWWKQKVITKRVLESDPWMMRKIGELLWSESIEESGQDIKSSTEQQVDSVEAEIAALLADKPWEYEVPEDTLNQQEEFQRLSLFIAYAQEIIDDAGRSGKSRYETYKEKCELSTGHFNIVGKRVWGNIFDYMTDEVKQSSRLRKIFSLVSLEELERHACDFFWEDYETMIVTRERTKKQVIKTIEASEDGKYIPKMIGFNGRNYYRNAYPFREIDDDSWLQFLDDLETSWLSWYILRTAIMNRIKPVWSDIKRAWGSNFRRA